jgi:hypothetical protein
MSRRHARIPLLLLTTALLAGCGTPPRPDYPAMTGRRVQGVDVVADGAEPYRVGAYELVFAERSGEAHPRRAALVVDQFGPRGRVQGFTEWGRAGERPRTYAVGGWASQRAVDGQAVTVFDLTVNALETGYPGDRPPVHVRVVVNEGSGDVTLTRSR